MNIKTGSILPTSEVLLQCRAGLTKTIRKTKSKLTQTNDADIKNHFRDKLLKLKTIRKEIQYLLDVT